MDLGFVFLKRVKASWVLSLEHGALHHLGISEWLTLECVEGLEFWVKGGSRLGAVQEGALRRSVGVLLVRRGVRSHGCA